MKMSIKRLLNLTFASICIALTLIGVLLFPVYKNANQIDNQITITINEDTTNNLYVNLKEINPGSEEKYAINLDGENLYLFNISLTFLNNDNSGNLDNYLTLVLSTNDYKFEKSLHEVLKNQETFYLGFNVKNIYITYKMDQSIGNEAQNATADFLINLTAKIESI